MVSNGVVLRLDHFLSSASMNLKSFSMAAGIGIVPASYLAILGRLFPNRFASSS
jgi:hypothetical protein